MGLCKCPKNKVTNLFCYEHRVNVCQYCMVKHHSQCIVQSYLQWLKDSDYDPNCTLCGDGLISDECIRLMCLHVYHWKCLDHVCSRLPVETAPAGFKCPSCGEPIFPVANVATPVADQLREKLETAKWASIPLNISETLENTQKSEGNFSKISADYYSAVSEKPTSAPYEDTVLFLDYQVNKRPVETAQLPRRAMPKIPGTKWYLAEEDEKKDRRGNPVISWIIGCFKSITHKIKRCPRMQRQGKLFVLIIAVTVILFFTGFSVLGRITASDDPTYNSYKNPQIR